MSLESRTKTRIVVIDDDPNVADSLAMLLCAYGYDTIAEYSGTAGIERAAEFVPHIVICDVMMPDMDGLQVAAQIRERLRDCRIVLFSAVPDYVRRMQEARGDAMRFEVLAKPLSPVSLLDWLGPQAEAG